jgi:hypothetical protein
MSEALAPPRRPSWRWLVILAVSLLSHLLVFSWAGGYLGMPVLRETPPPVVSATLITPPPPPPPVAAAPKPRAKPRPPRKRPPVPVPETLSTHLSAPAAEPAPEAQAQAAEPAAAEPMPDSANNAPTPNEEQNEEPNAPTRYKIDPPPSAQLDYDVTAMRDGQNWYGAGSFRWDAGSDSYSIVGEASVRILFKITVLNFKSEGAINEFGIAPLLYSEKPWRKEPASTHFEQEQGRISFSASGATYPYQGGEQDRASVTWQLAAIGRGEPSRFSPGAEIEIMVAGTRNADLWHIRIIGEEPVTTPHGTFNAWHLRRDPRPGSREQGIDFWLAPQLEWYPVRVRYTYANNDYLDMSLSQLTPGAAHRSP